jgi:hypothetical protein
MPGQHSRKAVMIAADNQFQNRVRLVLIKCAVSCIDDDNTARADFARRVLAGTVNIQSAAMAVLVDAPVLDRVGNIELTERAEARAADAPPGAAIRSPETMGDEIEDALIQGALMPDETDKRNGIFHKLAVANAAAK